MDQDSANIKILIDQCLNGNQLAEDQIFRLYYSRVNAICKRYSRNKEESAEMLNDCFYRMFTQLDKYDPAFPFSPWLHRLSVNCCLRYLQKNKSRLHFYEWDEKVINDYSSIPLPESRDLNYLKLLQVLPEACKTIINLYVIEGYKHHEIAEMLNISVGTSKSQLHKAKKLLYEALEKVGRGRLKIKSDYGR